MAAFKTRGYRTFIFHFFWQFFFFLILAIAATIKCGSRFPKAVFYIHGFKYCLKLRV